MNILIKSYYRPYLLDRCLRSIYEKVNDAKELNIIVLDDGTPQKYLDKISEKYPQATFKFSKYREEKIEKLDKHLKGIEQYHDRRIPTDLWYDAITESSEILIMTEDDVWFIENFDMSYYAGQMRQYDIHLLKLGRTLQKDADIIPHQKLTNTVSYHNPRFILKSKKFYNLLLNNTFNCRTILEQYKLLPKRWIMQLWVMYDIPMGMYRKDYLQFLWKDKYKRVIELLQLRNAVDWAFRHKGEYKYTLMNNRVMETSYRSSASFNSFNIKENFDLIRFNYILNELWYNDEFDEYQNYPHDFSVDYIYTILLKNESREFADNWKKWTEGFIEMHKNS